MNPRTHRTIRAIMHSYVAEGKKSKNKTNQINSLVRILDDIFRHEGTENLNAIGHRQIIGFWRRNDNADSSRYNMYLILNKFFSRLETGVTVPYPKKQDHLPKSRRAGY